MLGQQRSALTFEHEQVSRSSQLIRSTCDRCGALIFGRYPDGSLEKWQREHDCDNSVTKLNPIRRLRSWFHIHLGRLPTMSAVPGTIHQLD
jgi:hypothetical protein